MGLDYDGDDDDCVCGVSRKEFSEAFFTQQPKEEKPQKTKWTILEIMLVVIIVLIVAKTVKELFF